MHVPFEDDLSLGRHFDIDRLALHHINRVMSQEAGEQELVHARRERSAR